MSNFKNIFVVVFMILIAAGMTGCEKEGPMEQAGKAVDEAVKDTGDTIADAKEKEKMEETIKEEQDKK